MELKNCRSISDYLGRGFRCSCGHFHRSALERVQVGPDAMKGLGELVREKGFSHVFLVADPNTWEAAGELARDVLREAGAACVCKILPSREPVPDETSLGSLLMAVPAGTDLVVAVGTGTINDCCKFLSFRMGLPYVVVATAPSMDGFASVGAALITDNLKTTYDAHVPLAIFADTGILSKAPMEMIAAGVGDILGKYTCLCDWQMAHIICGEYHCPQVEEMVRRSIRQVRDNLAGIPQRDPEAIQSVTEALILTGIAMSFVGNSRPASGCEHHLSHYWEMQFLFQGRKPVLHGAKVGVGTVLALRMYESLMAEEPDFSRALEEADRFDAAAWEEEMRRLYGPAADGVIRLERRTGKNAPAGRRERLEVIRARWEDIRGTAKKLLPPSEEVEELLRSLGAPVSPLDVGVDREMTRDAIVAAKEVRNRYTLLQLLWDLGLSQEMAEKMTASL